MKTRKTLSLLVALAMLIGMITIPATAEDTYKAEAFYGSPKLGTNDKLWEKTEAFDIENAQNDATKERGVGRVMWDPNFLYVRVEVTDDDIFTGNSTAHLNDSVEVFAGEAVSGGNQYRLNAAGVASAIDAAETCVELTDTGYIAEFKIAKGNLLTLVEDTTITFDIQINGASTAEGKRTGMVAAFGTPDAAYSSFASFTDSLMLRKADDAEEVEELPIVIKKEPLILPPPLTFGGGGGTGWNSVMSNEPDSNITAAMLSGALGIEIEFSSDPGATDATFDFAWQGTVDWTFNEIKGLKTEDYYEDGVLTIMFADLDGVRINECSAAKFFVAFWNGKLENATKAYLIYETVGEPGEGDEDEEPGDAEPGLGNFKAVREYDDNFTDITWGAEWITLAYEYGLIEGSGDKYGFKNNISVQDTIVFAAKFHAIYFTGSNDAVTKDAVYPDSFIDYAIEHGIIKAGDFSDYKAAALRKEVAYILGNAIPLDEMEAVNEFISVEDVDEDDKYFDAVKLFYEAGIVSGLGNGLFGFNLKVERSQIAVMLVRLAGIDRIEGEVFEFEPYETTGAGVYVWDEAEGGNSWSGANIILGDNADAWPFAANTNDSGEEVDPAFAPRRFATYTLTFNFTVVGDYCPGIRVRWIGDNSNGSTYKDQDIVNNYPCDVDDVAVFVPVYFRIADGEEWASLVEGETYTVTVLVFVDGDAAADGLTGNIAIRGGGGSNQFSINWIEVEDAKGNLLASWDVEDGYQSSN